MILVFDLDGTLVDSSRDLAEAVGELLASYGAEPLPLADVVAMVGDGAPLLVRRALDRRAIDAPTPGALERFMAIYDRRLTDHTVAYEGMREVLAGLVHVGPLAVLTNKPLAPTLQILDALGLRGFFSVVLGGDGPHRRKPHPDGLVAIAQGCRAAPGAGLVLVGDSPADHQTAAAAGAAFVFARYGFGAAKFGPSPPDTPWMVDHPRELPAVVAAIPSA